MSNMTEKSVSCGECFAYKPQRMMQYDRTGKGGDSRWPGEATGWVCRNCNMDANGRRCTDDNGDCLFCKFDSDMHDKGCSVRAGEPDKITPGRI